MNKTFFTALCAIVGLSSAHGAIVTWGAAQNVTSAGDVLNTGTTVFALNIGAATNTVINGVTFSGNTNPGWGNQNFTGYGSHPVGGDYATALASGRYLNLPATTITISLTGLTIGQEYAFQTWINDRRDATVDTMRWDSGNSTPFVDISTSNTFSQYVTGSFIADSTTQSLRVAVTAGGGGATVNMMQLRAVPEPSTYGLMGAGALAGIAMVRRRRRA